MKLSEYVQYEQATACTLRKLDHEPFACGGTAEPSCSAGMFAIYDLASGEREW